MKREEIIDRWGVLIENGKGRADDIFSDTEGFIRKSEAPKVAVERGEVAPTIAKDILGVRRNFLVLTDFENPKLVNYKTFICARDYGNNLDVSWYLTYKLSLFEAILSIIFRGKYMPKLDLFDEQDLRAYVTNAHHSLLKAVEKLMLKLDQDPSRIESLPMENNQIEKIKEMIKRGNDIHLEEEAFLVNELGGFGTGSGFELGGKVSDVIRAETDEEYKEMALDRAIHYLWGDAGVCYKKRRFRACTILLACLVEAVICLELSKRRIFYNPKWTLGELINYCKGNNTWGISPPKDIKKAFTDIIKDLESVNRLRIEAVHLKLEKERPKEASKWDELVPIEKFVSPPVKIEGGWTSGDDVTLHAVRTLTGRWKNYIVYRYKKMAMKAYHHAQNILRTLYRLKFNFRF